MKTFIKLLMESPMKLLMKQSTKRSVFTVVGLSLIALPAFAHPGEHSSGFWAGFIHPFTGLDHLAAMLLLGVWFATLTKTIAIKSGVASIGVFVLALLLGGYLPINSIAAIEWAVLFSGVAVGALILFKMRLGQLAPIAAATLMASHGLVHGTEVTGNLMDYALGACSGMLVLVGLAYIAALSFRYFRSAVYLR